MLRRYDRCGISGCASRAMPVRDRSAPLSKSGRTFVPFRAIVALAATVLTSGIAQSAAAADQGAPPADIVEPPGVIVAPPGQTSPSPDDIDTRQDPSGTDQDGGAAARPQPDVGGGCPYRGRRLELIV
ncbi:MAG: hypothetical protein JNM89_10260 [Hyphomicrobiaceae bacterium]|nr:hypothetical protein [Hyphomicrobiaceae bacterium]